MTDHMDDLMMSNDTLDTPERENPARMRGDSNLMMDAIVESDDNGDK